MINKLSQKEIKNVSGGECTEIGCFGVIVAVFIAFVFPSLKTQRSLCILNCDHWQEDGWEFQQDCEKSVAIIQEHCTCCTDTGY